MRILVCGSRRFEDFSKMDEVLCTLTREIPDQNIHIIQGGAKGADNLAREWAYMCNKPCTNFPALWHKYGKAAGAIRNQQMLDEGKPDLVVAFLAPNSRGTRDMIARAEAAMIETKVIHI